MTLRLKRGNIADLPNGEIAEPLYCIDENVLYIGQGLDNAPIDVLENIKELVEETNNFIPDNEEVTNQDYQDVIDGMGDH